MIENYIEGDRVQGPEARVQPEPNYSDFAVILEEEIEKLASSGIFSSLTTIHYSLSSFVGLEPKNDDIYIEGEMARKDWAHEVLEGGNEYIVEYEMCLN